MKVTMDTIIVYNYYTKWTICGIDKCRVYYNNSYKMRQHIKKEHNILVIYQCKQCNAQLTSKGMFKKHEYEVHNISPYAAYKRRGFDKKSNIKNTYLYICPILRCHEEFEYIDNIYNHLLTGHNLDDDAINYELNNLDNQYKICYQLVMESYNQLFIK